MNDTTSKTSLLDEMRTKLRREGYAYATEKSYCDWVKRFVRFHHFQDREAMLQDSTSKVEAFLSDLALGTSKNKATCGCLDAYDLTKLLPWKI